MVQTMNRILSTSILILLLGCSENSFPDTTDQYIDTSHNNLDASLMDITMEYNQGKNLDSVSDVFNGDCYWPQVEGTYVGKWEGNNGCPPGKSTAIKGEVYISFKYFGYKRYEADGHWVSYDENGIQYKLAIRGEANCHRLDMIGVGPSIISGQWFNVSATFQVYLDPINKKLENGYWWTGNFKSCAAGGFWNAKKAN